MRGSDINKIEWWPASSVGKIALALCVVAVIYGIFLPSILSFFQHIIGGLINAIVVLSLEVILIIVAFYLSCRAIFRNKDRAILNIAAFCLLCLVGAFWLVFAVGELVYPH